jgi:hypothetical protein
MKRTTLWVTLAATGVQLAALGLCAWAMSNARSAPVALPKPRPNGAGAPATVETVPLAVEITVPEPVAVAEPEVSVIPPIAELVHPAPEPIVEPLHVAPEPVASAVAVVEAPPLLAEPIFAEPVVVEPEPAPVATAVAEAEIAEPAPTRAVEIPRFIRNLADDTTVVVAAERGGPPLVFGVFEDGSVRCVDVDNGCYAGKAEGSRSRMREVAGSRAFTVQLEPHEDGSYEASFIGGLHDAQQMVLLPVAPVSGE